MDYSGNTSQPIRLPHRYLLALMSAAAMLLAVGTRVGFAFVLTYFAAVKRSSSPAHSREGLIFAHCTAMNQTTAIFKMDLINYNMFIFHAVYYTSFFIMIIPGHTLSVLFPPKKLTETVSVIYTATTFLIPLVIPFSVPLLFVLCILHGVLEGIKYPSVVMLMASWSTYGDKFLMFAIMTCGIIFAPGLASVLTGFCLCYVSWDSIFSIYGCFDTIWTLLLLHSFYDTPELHPGLSKEEYEYHSKFGIRDLQASKTMFKNMPWQDMLASRHLWALILGTFTWFTSFNLMVIGQQQYFLDAFDIRAEDFGVLALTPYILMTGSFIASETVCYELAKMNVINVTVRKLFHTAGSLIESVMLFSLCYISDWKAAFTLWCIGLVAAGTAIIGCPSCASDLMPHYSGFVHCLALAGIFGGVFSSWLAAILVGQEKTLQAWQLIFQIVGLLSMANLLLNEILVDNKHLPWHRVSISEPTVEQTLTETTAPVTRRHSVGTPVDQETQQITLVEDLV